MDIKSLNLKPLVAKKAQDLLSFCNLNNIKIDFVSGYRSFQEQNALYAQGRTVPGSIVTNAKGGQSLHNYKLAFDICIYVNGAPDWNTKRLDLWKKVGAYGESIGFTWGGRFTTISDWGHFELLCGYTEKQVMNNQVDWSKWELPKIVVEPQAIQSPIAPAQVVPITTPEPAFATIKVTETQTSFWKMVVDLIKLIFKK